MPSIVLILLLAIVAQATTGCPNDLSFPLGYVPIDAKSVPCPDGQSSCPDGETCCQLSSGQYGCCPIPDAVCCNDHLHCCPNGFTCDVEHGRCQKGFEQSNGVVCPDGDTSCADGLNVCFSKQPRKLAFLDETCCQLQSGDYGCCPLPDAVCCSDQSHCCPHGYTCDVQHNKCQKGFSIPWFTKKAALPISQSLTKVTVSTIQCPDDRSFCPEETTCCELTGGAYGCCPYRQASCCSDKIHCCGDGYSCDESGSRCIRHFDAINATTIEPKRIENRKLVPLIVFEEQTCPDGITKCSLASTCCPNKDKNEITYSCCPYSRGVCCGANGSICCPFKYICDEGHLTCQLNSTVSLDNENVTQCGSADIVCPANQTCCRGHDDQYACCAFPHGVCCDDGRHCCPNGTKCDQKSDGCLNLSFLQ